ncbi:MAG: hypothetical protein ABFR97_11080 [Thermodesulfobacteriota bacterium]
MKKNIIAIIVAIAMAGSSSAALAATSKCTVTSVKDNVVTLDCGTKAGALAVGQEVKVKSAKKKAIEGC